jgi:prepilin-type N-terminal cleavage/methylation domain-containing protein
MKKIRTSQQGFTIVELMIATVVFSLVLVTITYGVLHFTSEYYKGVNSSTTQDTARSVMDTISQSIQFSGETAVAPSVDADNNDRGYFCVGSQVFVYTLGVQYMGSVSPTTPGLYVMSGTCPSSKPATLANGQELLDSHMRLAELSVLPVTGVAQAYTVSIRLAYSSGGDPAHDGDDLLCSPSTSTGATACSTPFKPGTELSSDYIHSDLICRSQIGSQFCAVSGLSSTVVQRVAPGL